MRGIDWVTARGGSEVTYIVRLSELFLFSLSLYLISLLITSLIKVFIDSQSALFLKSFIDSVFIVIDSFLSLSDFVFSSPLSSLSVAFTTFFVQRKNNEKFVRFVITWQFHSASHFSNYFVVQFIYLLDF